MRGIAKIMDIFLGVPAMRIVVTWGLYWGSPILGNYHISLLIAEAQRLGRTSLYDAVPLLIASMAVAGLRKNGSAW